MNTDHSVLCTWQTSDLISQDQKLWAKTAVWGMSQNALMIHVVALVFTSGASLPFNLWFGSEQMETYKKVKCERNSIRHILIKRNVLYQGKGQWVIPIPR